MNPDLSPYTCSQDVLHQALLDAGATQKGRKYFCPFHDDTGTPNGSIKEGEDGKWRYLCFSCHAGGDYFDVVARTQGRPVEQVIAETMRADTPPETPKTKPKKETKKKSYKTAENIIQWAEKCMEGKCTQRYEYTDPDTRTLEIAVIRIEKPEGGKEFWQYYPVKGGFEIGLPPDAPRPLYNRARIKTTDTILLVEGEKCVHALHDIGIIATNVLGGANARMDKTDWQPLAGKTVVIWPDNDEPGQTYAKNATAQLKQLTSAATVITLDPEPLDLGPKGDVVDYIERAREEGKTNDIIRQQIHTLFESARPPGPGTEVINLVEDIVTGIHKPIDWIWPQLSRQTNALLPATVTIVGGTPGCSKSWFVLQNAMHFFDEGESVAMLMLEEPRKYWLRRALVIKARNSLHLDAKWMREHADEAREMAKFHRGWMDNFGECIHAVKGLYTEFPSVVKWVAEQAMMGVRIIIVDPITLAVVDGELFKEELKFLSMMKQDIEASGSSLILVTHPKQGNIPIGMNAMAGSAAYQRAVQTILWLEHLDEDNEFLVRRVNEKAFSNPIEEVIVHCNRSLHILKARNGQGHNLKVAYHFLGKTVSFAEQGLIVKSTHKNKAGA